MKKRKHQLIVDNDIFMNFCKLAGLVRVPVVAGHDAGHHEERPEEQDRGVGPHTW